MSKPMTPEQFAKGRRKLGLSQDACGEAMGLTGPDPRRTIIRWEKGIGVRSIPGPAQVLMRAWLDGYRPRATTFPNDKRTA